MAADTEDDFDKAFAGFGEDPKQPVSPSEEPKKPEEPVTPAPDKPKEDENVADKDKSEDTTPPSDKQPIPPESDKSAGKTKDGADSKGQPGDEDKDKLPEDPKPLTEDGVKSIIRDIQTEERTGTRQLDETTKEVMDTFYPNGLSNVLTDQATGKELKTPQDVVDVSNGEMDIEQATQWLMNEQYKLDKQIDEIKADAKNIAENTINFKRDSALVLEKYEPLFKWRPSLQDKIWNLLKKQVKADTEKGVIYSAPDVIEFYRDYLEPYQQAYEHSLKQPATNPNPPAPEPPKPSTDDRLDEGGDGGASGDSDDPNDFAQQVNKELAKGL